MATPPYRSPSGNYQNIDAAMIINGVLDDFIRNSHAAIKRDYSTGLLIKPGLSLIS